MRSDRSALLALARAIGSSPGWGGPVTFVARVAPEPVLGIFGAGERLDRARFALQVRAAESGMGRLRYVGYREAERAAEQLAHRLVERFGEGPLRSFRWAALPRGGLLVLGMLAARLGLPPQRLGASPPGEGQGEPLVVVDDCALSGARFAAFLAGLSAPRVVFAHLYSPAALREAVVTREPRVLACLAARDLDADGAADVAEEWSEARRRWAQRLDGDRYGPGAFERIAFPWNEPDRLLWNPEAAGVELGWKLVPPELCLKQRAGAGTEPTSRSPVQVQPRGAGPWRPAGTVLFARRRGDTTLYRLDTGQVFRLSGTAHAMWWALLRAGEVPAAAALLGDRYRVSEKNLVSDLSRFLDKLQESGLLEYAPES